MTHKKRGRPPLKAEDSQTRRAFVASPSDLPAQQSQAPSSPAALERSHFGLEPSPSSLRDLRPLQSPRQGDPNQPRDSLRPQPLGSYGTIAVGQAQISPFGPPRPPSHRPFSSTSSTASSAQPPSPYFHSPGFPPGVGLSPSFESQPRSLPPAAVASYAQQQGASVIQPTPPSRTSGYQTYRPVFPQPTNTAEAETGSFARSRPSSRSLTTTQTLSELQLPPIRPAPTGARVSEAGVPALPSTVAPGQVQALPLETGSPSSGQGGVPGMSDDGTGSRDSKRARMDLGGMLGPGHE